MTEQQDQSVSLGDTLRQLAESTQSLLGALKDCRTWPPDLFAVTSILLQRTGAYRLVVSPPPQKRFSLKLSQSGLEKLADVWLSCLSATQLGLAGAPPCCSTHGTCTLCEWLADLADALGKDCEGFGLGAHWNEFRLVATLHALADIACSGVGMASSLDRSSTPHKAIFLARAHERLIGAGNLSTFRLVRVLPKLRAPATGMTIRSLSHHVCCIESEFKVVWHVAPQLVDAAPMQLRLLVVPWPRHVGPRDFSEQQGSGLLARTSSSARNVGFFTFHPQSDHEQLSDLLALLEESERKGLPIDGVILPELAVSHDQLEALVRGIEAWNSGSPQRDDAGSGVARHRVRFLLAGARDRPASSEPEAERLAVNEATMVVLGDDHSRRAWFQPKHHRWRLDPNQIAMYRLGARLNPNKTWWEGVDLADRRLDVAAANGWLTFCPLICEDLTRLDPVGNVVRAIGPNLIIALLLDAPQLRARWPARFAQVLSEDPGCAVLTVTSRGLCTLSRPLEPGTPAAPHAVAFWSAQGSATELRLDNFSQDEVEPEPSAVGDALHITISATWRTEHTADGRTDHNTAPHLSLSRVVPVLAPKNGQEGRVLVTPDRGFLLAAAERDVERSRFVVAVYAFASVAGCEDPDQVDAVICAAAASVPDDARMALTRMVRAWRRRTTHDEAELFNFAFEEAESGSEWDRRARRVLQSALRGRGVVPVARSSRASGGTD